MSNKSDSTVENRARDFIESLFSDSNLFSGGTRHVIGNIDCIDNRTLTGWVVDKEDPDAAVPFGVYAGNRKVGQAVADIYREDLQSAGYGNGCHGFKLVLDSRILDGKKNQITLREENTGAQIISNRFYAEAKADYVAEILGITERRMTAEIVSVSGRFEDLSIEILVDCGRRLPCAQTNTDGNKLLVEAVLSDDLFDGLPHSYEVIINNASCSTTVHVEVIYPVTTPEKFLGDSIGKPGYPFASRIALQRYQSLARQVERCVAEDCTREALNNLTVAHKALEAGSGKRRDYEPLCLPDVYEPDVSILVPARNHFAVTYHCLASLILSHNEASFEVVLIDDASDDNTAQIEEIVKNLRVVRNQNNQGYLLSNKQAARVARGRYLCLLNNDTEVTAGWIDNALALFDLYANVGSVGCKLIYPDGKLQEAGGLVWKSGAPWNYGKLGNASHPRFNYVRQADYLSAAALFVRSDVWREVDGFSEEYAPAYYEDTDLAYKIRQSGYKTLYCPMSTVIHFEGVSNGTDTSSGLKAYQQVNSAKFRSRWHKEFRHYAVEGDQPEHEVDRNCTQRILVVDADTPRLNNDAGSYAAIQEMKMLMELGSKLVFLPLNFAHLGVHTERLQTLGVECLHYPFYTSVEQVLQLRGGEFDVVYLTRYETVHTTVEAIREFTNAKIIFNNADLHFMRELREQLQIDGKELDGPLATREKELEAIKSVDMTLCYTETERAVIASHVFSEDAVKRCPWVVEPVEQIKPFSERDGIAFLGGYKHQPNVDAVRYFCSEIMPVLNKHLPDLVLRVYGSGMPDEFAEMATTNVEMIGYVEELDEVYGTARVFVSPLLTGAGLNGKMIDCMAHGLPSVVSPLTADGTGLIHRQSALVAESIEDWVDLLCELYDDEKLWNQLSVRSIETAGALFSGAEGVKRMSGILSALGIYSDANGSGLFNGYVE